MLKKLTSVLIHVLMLAVVCAVAAYWGVRILTPQPTAAPPPLAAPAPREPDPMLAARMFGLVQQPTARVVSNIQVAGIFAAGKDSSAVLTVDGKPARVYVLGQDVTPGTRLVEVRADGVVVESGGGRQELRAPARPAASMATGAAPRAYVLEDGSLSAPASAAAAPASAAQRAPVMPNVAPPPAPMPPPGVPQRPVAPGVPADAVVPGHLQSGQPQPGQPQPVQPVPGQGAPPQQ
jgi:general secretion pathway protein C